MPLDGEWSGDDDGSARVFHKPRPFLWGLNAAQTQSVVELTNRVVEGF